MLLQNFKKPLQLIHGGKKINPSACCYLEEYDASGVWVTEPGYFGVHSVNLQCSNVNVNFQVYT